MRTTPGLFLRMKPATTYEEQYSKLLSRGLLIPSKDRVISFLKENNYYRFTGYAKLYTKPDSDDFIDGLTFDKLFNIYTFDSELRAIINVMVAQIEVTVRTQLAYNLSNNISPYCYKNKIIFSDENFFKETNKIIENEIKKASDEPMIKHFAGKQKPFWVIIEILSFGVVSKLYANLLTENKKLVSSGTYYNINYEYFGNYLNVCTSIRNNCAHRARLYGKTFTTAPRFSKKEKKKYGDPTIVDNYFITNGSSTSLFECIYACMKLIIKPKNKKKYINMFSKLIAKYNSDIELTKIGFPKNWKEILIS